MNPRALSAASFLWCAITRCASLATGKARLPPSLDRNLHRGYRTSDRGAISVYRLIQMFRFCALYDAADSGCDDFVVSKRTGHNN